ncbi:hypothetical protein SSX86_025017 [Deinandra increscens subsp. villosa]|uniref:Replication protein A 70 kDa DNA-binding subunit B/D first OB fold domain-containing protein n=1 Tax=Deinandra increscens subsp. villosa TaxID=3103831 RepID=A0AAP0CGX0_9ASTR
MTAEVEARLVGHRILANTLVEVVKGPMTPHNHDGVCSTAIPTVVVISEILKEDGLATQKYPYSLDGHVGIVGEDGNWHAFASMYWTTKEELKTKLKGILREKSDAFNSHQLDGDKINFKSSHYEVLARARFQFSLMVNVLQGLVQVISMGSLSKHEYKMSFFKVVRHPERPYLHIPNAAYRRYLHSQPPTYDINLFLRPDLRYVVGLREINHELFITQSWATIQNHVDIGLKYVLVFRIQDPRNWSVTILGDNCVNIDLRHIAPNYAIPVHWSDEDDDVDDVVAPPPAPAEAGQPIFPAEVAHPDPPAEAVHPEPPAEAAHPQPLAGAAQPDQPNLDDQPNDVHIAPVATFSQIVRINKSIAYVPPKLAALADLEDTMLLTIKVEDQEVYVAQVRSLTIVNGDLQYIPGYPEMSSDPKCQMAEMNLYDSLSDLQLANHNHNLKVRFLKTVIRPMFSNPNVPYSIEFVCVDEQGNRAQGTLLASFFYMFQRFLVEQTVVTIKKPMLGSNGGSWRVIDSPFKICFNRESKVAVSADWNGTNHGFSFTDFKTIIAYIIGILIECSPIKTKIKDDKESKWVVIKLQDLSGSIIWVTLFDDYATKITDYVLSNPGVPHKCVVIQFAMFKVFKDRHSLSNSFNISNLFINDPDIEEITTFLERFSATEAGQSSSSYRSGSNCGLMSKEYDFLTVTSFKYSAEVHQMNEATPVVVVGTIKLIENQWFYMACNHCRKIVTSFLGPAESTEGQPSSPQEVLKYYCNTEDCKKNNLLIEPYPRYKVLLKVQDSTGNVDLTLFGTEAEKIIRKTAIEDGVPVINLPDEIEAFIDKRYAFKIDVTDNHISGTFKYYTIISVTDDEKIISSLDEKYFKNEVDTDHSGIKSSDNISAKDVISICDDNVTPSSVNTSAKHIDHDEDSNQLKRNLHESYENDVVPTMSSAKKQSSGSNDAAEPVIKAKLLIPKKEK